MRIRDEITVPVELNSWELEMIAQMAQDRASELSRRKFPGMEERTKAQMFRRLADKAEEADSAMVDALLAAREAKRHSAAAEREAREAIDSAAEWWSRLR